MEKFNSVELLYRSIRSMAVEGESTVLGTAHAPNRSIRSNRLNSFKWKLGLMCLQKFLVALLCVVLDFIPSKAGILSSSSIGVAEGERKYF